MNQKIYFLNDTSSCHAGSAKVVENFRHFMKKQEIIGSLDVSVNGRADKKLIEACDILVINAEGSIHHNAPWGCALLEAMSFAQSLNKKTYLLNCLYEKMDHRYDEVIKRADQICAREIYSYEILRKLNDNTVLFPDYCICLEENGHVLKNVHGAVKTRTHHASIYKNVFDGIEIPEISIGPGRFCDYIETYRFADVILTGQHHAVYAAALASVPFIPTFGNSHKIESLIEWSGLPIRMCASPQQVYEDMERIKFEPLYKEIFDEFSNFIQSKRKDLEKYLIGIFS